MCDASLTVGGVSSRRREGVTMRNPLSCRLAGGVKSDTIRTTKYRPAWNFECTAGARSPNCTKENPGSNKRVLRGPTRTDIAPPDTGHRRLRFLRPTRRFLYVYRNVRLIKLSTFGAATDHFMGRPPWILFLTWFAPWTGKSIGDLFMLQ